MAHVVPIPTLLRGYDEGRRSVQEMVQLCRTFRGPEPHWLWQWVEETEDRRLRVRTLVIQYCCMHLTEEKLFELLRALVADNPHVPRIADAYRWSFLHAALDVHRRQPGAGVSTRVLLLLAAPGATRGPQDHPLHLACANVEARRVCTFGRWRGTS
jgi:hypothetical protein